MQVRFSPRFAGLAALLLLTALTLPAGKKPTVANGRGENEDLVLTATLHIDPEEIKELIGNDLGGHYIVAEVKVEPKYGKDIVIDRDDFRLRTDKDGERTTPYAPSQIAGRGALIIDEVAKSDGIASPGWTGTKVPVVRKDGAAKSADGSKPADGAAKSAPAAPEPALQKTLEAKILPEGKTDKPVSGLLYFPMEKQKMKDLELYYGGRENRITMRFKP
jgi:hypothetical protein